MGKIVLCGSCGGELDDTCPKCPYCGSTNIKGAELEYMRTLESVRGDMGELDNVPLKELRKAVKKQGHFLKISILVIVVIAAAAALAVFLLNREDKKDYKEEYLWQQEYFPRLSQLYDNGDYDAMIELATQAMDENPSASFWTWEHFNFYDAYVSANLCKTLIPLWGEEYLSGNEYSLLLYSEWNLVCLEEYDQAKYTEKELEVLAPYIELAREALASDWGMTDEEYQEFLQLAEENHHFVPSSSCEEYVKQWLKKQK